MLKQKGWDVIVYTSSIGRNSIINKFKLFPIFSLRAFEIAHTPVIFSMFFRLLILKKPAIIHVHIAQAFVPEIVYLASKIRSIPYVAHVHLDVDESGVFGFLLRPYKKLFLTHVLKNAKKVICLSETQKLAIIKKNNIKKDNIKIIPNGVSKLYFSKTKRNFAPPFHILFVGRLAKQKNLPFLLNAIAKMKQKVILDIVGSGDERKVLEKLVIKYNISNIVFHGDKRGIELLKIYKYANILAMTSTKEGVSLVVLEAMAQGLPIVSSDVEGMRELVKDCGLLVKSPTPIAFANVIDSLIANPTLMTTLSKNSMIKAAGYSWKNTVKKIEDLYEEIFKETYAN